MEEDETLYSKDGKCPYCKSDNVRYTGVKTSDVRASSTGEYPKSRHKIWKCNNCNKTFQYAGE